MPNPELSQRIRALPEELLGLEREPGTAECLRRIDALKGRARALEPLDGVEEMALSDYDRTGWCATPTTRTPSRDPH